jgi:thioredoxin 1
MVTEINDADFEGIIKKNDTVLVDFWAPWCGPCIMMGPVIDQVSAECADNALVCKMNVDDNPKTAQRFGIMSIPSFLLFRDGELVETITGAVPKEKLLNLLD